MHKSISALFVLALATVASAGITTADFAGSGNIAVLAGDDWREASPTKDKVGCLNSHGKLIKDDGKEACGVFTRLNTYPYTLSTKEGNCTFVDKSQEKNTDSYYGANDYAFNCNPAYESVIYDQLYTIVSFFLSQCLESSTHTHRTAFPTSSSASVTSPVSTTQRRPRKVRRYYRSGSTAGARIKRASRLATYRCC
jgi:hypothetical protein